MNRFHSKSVLIIKTSMLISNALIISFLINMYSAYSKKMMHFISIYFVFFIFLILCKVTPRLKNLNKTSKLSSKTRHKSSQLDLVCRNSIDAIYNNVYYLCWLNLHFTNLQILITYFGTMRYWSYHNKCYNSIWYTRSEEVV